MMWPLLKKQYAHKYKVTNGKEFLKHVLLSKQIVPYLVAKTLWDCFYIQTHASTCRHMIMFYCQKVKSTITFVLVMDFLCIHINLYAFLNLYKFISTSLLLLLFSSQLHVNITQYLHNINTSPFLCLAYILCIPFYVNETFILW